MHILVLTKSNGTPFDVTSILEEDIIKICIQLGHTHPMGVLCYSATKSIMLFQSAEDMQCATCRVTKAMVLCEEAITIRASLPSAAHVRAYMAVVGGEPCRIPPPPSEGEEELHLPAGNPHLGGGTLQHLQADLGSLADDELCKPMEDLCWEVRLCELNTPSRSPPQCLGESSRKWGF